MSDERPPVHEELDVLDSETVYRADDWWKAVVLYDGWNGKEVAVYLWKNEDGNWKRQNKFKIGDKQEWLAVKGIIDGFADEL